MEHSFTPGDSTSRAFRDALGQFATGVTVVTTMSEDGPLGITANSFAALSLDPALVLWAPGKFSRRFMAFDQAAYFAIHVLRADQAALAHHFAANGTDFNLSGLSAGVEGTPLLAGCLSRFECRRFAAHDGGDHRIIVGEVLRVTTTTGEALGFFKGQYVPISAPSASMA